MKKSILARTLFALAAGIVAMHAIGCNTTKGVGEDMKDAGDSISDSAERNK